MHKIVSLSLVDQEPFPYHERTLAGRPMFQASFTVAGVRYSMVGGFMRLADQIVQMAEYLGQDPFRLLGTVKESSGLTDLQFEKASAFAFNVLGDDGTQLMGDTTTEAPAHLVPLTGRIFSTAYQFLMAHANDIDILVLQSASGRGREALYLRWIRAVPGASTMADFKIGQVRYWFLEKEGAITQARHHNLSVPATHIIDFGINHEDLKQDPDYVPAKAGSNESAVSLVERYLTRDVAVKVMGAIPPGCIFCAPHAEERSGRNAIPVTMAEALSELCRGTVDMSVVQANRAGHTGARMMPRLVSRVEFDGEVVDGGKYVLVDDNLTSGGTLADLGSFIKSEGGQIVAVIVLTTSSRSGTFTPKIKVLDEIERRFGNEIREELGIDPYALTEAEALYLIGFKDVDQLRDSIAKARQDQAFRLKADGNPEASYDRATVDHRVGVVASLYRALHQGTAQKIIAYHGTEATFEDFSLTDPVNDDTGVNALWFTSDPKHAGEFGSVIPVELNPKNPMVIDQRDLVNELKNTVKSLAGMDPFLAEDMIPRDAVPYFMDIAHRNGHDLLVITDFEDLDYKATVYLTYDPTIVTRAQPIRSAYDSDYDEGDIEPRLLSDSEYEWGYNLAKEKYPDILTKMGLGPDATLEEYIAKEKANAIEYARKHNAYGKKYKELRANPPKTYNPKDLAERGWTEYDFVRLHKTGYIQPSAYKQYKDPEFWDDQDNWFNASFASDSKKYGTEVMGTKELPDGPTVYAVRILEPLRYSKTTPDRDLVRDENGEPVVLTKEEMKEKGLNEFRTTLYLINQYTGRIIGWASDEFGADGVWVDPRFSGKGLGSWLLGVFRSQFNERRKIGQMTEEGIGMTAKYWRNETQGLNQSVDDAHKIAYAKTGRWGAQGAGCIIIASDTKRILLPLRSEDVLEPGTWGTWGGAIDPSEDPAEAVERELMEEAGYSGELKLIPGFVYESQGFRYSNFFALVESEFNPTLNWETESATWFDADKLPSPLHFGLKAFLHDNTSQKILQDLTRAQAITSSAQPDDFDVQGEASKLRAKWLTKGVVLDLYPGHKTAILTIRVKDSLRNQGLATEAMTEAMALADRAELTVTLSPTSEWGSSKSRLIEFYKRFGFVENKGRNKDYAHMDTMYRRPIKSNTSAPEKAVDLTKTPEFKAWFGASKIVDESGKPLVVHHGSRNKFRSFDRSLGGKSNTLAGVGFWFSPAEGFADRFARESWYGDHDEPLEYNVYLAIRNPKIYTPKEPDPRLVAKLQAQIKDLERVRNVTISKYGWNGFATGDVNMDEYKAFNGDTYNPSKVRPEILAKAKDHKANEAQLVALNNQLDEARVTDSYEMYKVDVYARVGKSARDATIGGLGMMLDNPKDAVEKYRAWLESQGYDGIIIKDTYFDASTAGSKTNDQYVALHANQIKAVENDGSFDLGDQDIYSARLIREPNVIKSGAMKELFTIIQEAILSGEKKKRRQARRRRELAHLKDANVTGMAQLDGTVSLAGGDSSGPIMMSRGNTAIVSGVNIDNIAKVTSSPEFKAWFGNSKVVDEEGNPMPVYHGSTHSFDSFDLSKTNKDSFWGKGFYFTTNHEDANQFYGGHHSPDLKSRVENLAEEIATSLDQGDLGFLSSLAEVSGVQALADWEYSEPNPEMVKEFFMLISEAFEAIGADDHDRTLIQQYLDQYTEADDLTEDPAEEISSDSVLMQVIASAMAKKQIAGSHMGTTYMVFLKIENPADTAGRTLIPAMYVDRPEDADDDYEDEENPEFGILYEELNELLHGYAIDDTGDIWERAGLYDGEIYWSSLMKALEGTYAYDSEGESISAGAMLAEIAKIVGCDGIRQRNAHRDFRMMKGVQADHWIAWEPTQVKAVYNKGTWNPTDPKLNQALEAKLSEVTCLIESHKETPEPEVTPILFTSWIKQQSALQRILSNTAEQSGAEIVTDSSAGYLARLIDSDGFRETLRGTKAVDSAGVPIILWRDGYGSPVSSTSILPDPANSLSPFVGCKLNPSTIHNETVTAFAKLLDPVMLPSYKVTAKELRKLMGGETDEKKFVAKASMAVPYALWKHSGQTDLKAYAKRVGAGKLAYAFLLDQPSAWFNILDLFNGSKQDSFDIPELTFDFTQDGPASAEPKKVPVASDSAVNTLLAQSPEEPEPAVTVKSKLRGQFIKYFCEAHVLAGKDGIVAGGSPYRESQFVVIPFSSQSIVRTTELPLPPSVIPVSNYREKAQEVFDSLDPPSLSSVGIVRQTAPEPVDGTDLVSIYAHYQVKAQQALKGLTGPQKESVAVASLFHEAMDALSRPGSAIGWYDAKVKESMEIIKSATPDIDDPAKRIMFLIALAVTSNGVKADTNYAVATYLFNGFISPRDRFPESPADHAGTKMLVIDKKTKLIEPVELAFPGKAGLSMYVSFRRANQLRKFFGGDVFEMAKFMMSTMKTGDLERWVEANLPRLEVEVDDVDAEGNAVKRVKQSPKFSVGEQAFTEVRGAMLLGPKIGSFFSNLNGDYGTYTFDKWATRTMNRVKGTLFNPFTEATLQTLRSLVGVVNTKEFVPSEMKGYTYDQVKKELGLATKAVTKAIATGQKFDAVSFSKVAPSVVRWAKDIAGQWSRGGFSENGIPYDPNTPEFRLVRNINRWIGSPEETPGTSSNRTYIRAILERVRHRMAQTGISISNADLQALMWYYEKDLVKSASVNADDDKGDDDVRREDYADASRKVVERIRAYQEQLARQRASSV